MLEIRKTDKFLKNLLPLTKAQTNVKYIPSQFVFPFKHNGKNYVFNTLTKQCLETKLPESANAGEGFDQLIEDFFLVPENKDECSFYNSISTILRAYNKRKGINGYTILPTLGCNARCVYCYEEGMKQETMTSDVVEQTIRYILDSRDSDKVRLSWFGGEPLLCTDIIDKICAIVIKAGVKLKSSMITNGSLITTQIISKMKEDWKIGNIQISMDGAECDYIQRKNYYTYNNYYTKVIEYISALSEAGIKISIRCNVDGNNWDNIPNFIDDLKSGVTYKKKVSLYFTPLFNVRMGKYDLEMWEKIRDARVLIEEAGFRVTPFITINLGFRINHCMADSGKVVIGPDGSLYSCEHCPPGSKFGDIWNGVTDEKARYEFCRVDRTREKCRKCLFLPDCTSFASCPLYDTHCREMREMMILDDLRRYIDHKNCFDKVNDENLNC